MSLLRERTRLYKAPEEAQKKGIYPYFRAIESGQDTEVIVNGKRVLMFGSNSYLGLTNHPKVKEASIAAIRKYGSGCAGSRFLNGTLDIHEELEARLATFLNKEAVVTFSTGYHVNTGVISALTRKGDYVIVDKLDHASIIEGTRLAQSTVLKYFHNDMESLEKKLRFCEPKAFKLIVVDGIFSMEGDIVNLPKIVSLARKYDAIVMTDCAHAIGVIGEKGSGTPSHFGLNDEVDLLGGTFSKSLASIGGFIASDTDTINYIKHFARSLIFSASITPASAASALAALDILESDDSLMSRLWENTNYALKCIKEMGFDTGCGETPIIPIYIRNEELTFMLTQKLLDCGVFVNPVVHPGVDHGNELIRFTLMATHTKEQIDYALEKIFTLARELGILGVSSSVITKN